MSSSHVTVAVNLMVLLVLSEESKTPIVGSLSYASDDPYAIRMKFGVGTSSEVEWIVGRDLLAGGLTTPAGMGDVRVWPSQDEVFNIVLTSPQGRAQFQTSAADVSRFLERTYQIVPLSDEGNLMDIDAELDEILRQA